MTNLSLMFVNAIIIMMFTLRTDEQPKIAKLVVYGFSGWKLPQFSK